MLDPIVGQVEMHFRQIIFTSVLRGEGNLFSVPCSKSTTLTKYYSSFFCGLPAPVTGANPDGRPTLSAKVLKKMGDLGIELYLDTYCRSDEEQPRSGQSD